MCGAIDCGIVRHHASFSVESEHLHYACTIDGARGHAHSRSEASGIESRVADMALPNHLSTTRDANVNVRLAAAASLHDRSQPGLKDDVMEHHSHGELHDLNLERDRCNEAGSCSACAVECSTDVFVSGSAVDRVDMHDCDTLCVRERCGKIAREDIDSDWYSPVRKTKRIALISPPLLCRTPNSPDRAYSGHKRRRSTGNSLGFVESRRSGAVYNGECIPRCTQARLKPTSVMQSAVGRGTPDVVVTGLGVHLSDCASPDHVCETGDISMSEVGVPADVTGNNDNGVKGKGDGKGDGKGSGEAHMSSGAVGATIGSGCVLDMREAFNRTPL